MLVATPALKVLEDALQAAESTNSKTAKSVLLPYLVIAMVIFVKI